MSELQDGKKINQRSYSMILSSDEKKNIIKSGSRVPVVTGSFNSEGKPMNQFQYLDIGVNIEARLSEAEADWLKLDGDVDMSSVLQSEQSSTGPGQPIIRQNRQAFYAMIHPDKPTIIASLDDVNSTRTTQIEVTATRLK